jgi:dTDP-glucose pyrophosphorylase
VDPGENDVVSTFKQFQVADWHYKGGSGTSLVAQINHVIIGVYIIQQSLRQSIDHGAKISRKHLEITRYQFYSFLTL